MAKPFVHLHLHSEYSLLDGAIKFDNLMEKAADFGMPAVSLTDHGNLFGAMQFYNTAQKAGVKPIIGCEMYITPKSHLDKSPGARNHHLTVLSMNETGYKNLCRLVTTAYLDGFYRRPRIDHELLAEHNEGLIVLSGCLSGELCAALFKEEKNAMMVASKYKEILGDRYYLEIQATKLPEQERVNRKIVEIGKKLKIPVVATNDCHYLRREDARPHDVLLCIQTGVTVQETNRMKFSGEEFYLKDRDEMLEGVDGNESSLEMTLEVAERCEINLDSNGYKFPLFETEGGRPLSDHMADTAREGLSRRLSSDAIPLDKQQMYKERLELEISTIGNMGFSGYFLVVADFINHAKSNSIPVGPGRGSAAGSLVAYSLGITDIDPIPYNLLFERFLNPERISMPDIDVDICTEGRDEIIQYVTQKYGSDKVAQIGTFGTMSAKAVVKDVGRALGIPYADVDKLTKTIPSFRGKVFSIEDCINDVPEFKEVVKQSKALEGLLDVAKELENMVRHSSTHAAGVVISDGPLIDHIPLYKGQRGEIVTQYDMNAIEQLGFVKFDFLGLKTLTVINKAVQFIKSNNANGTSNEFDINKIPLDDPGVYKLLTSGRTRGIFQLESSGMVDLVKRLIPTTFEDIIAILALYRPGPLDSGMVDEFIKRKHGKKKITFPLPDLKEILEETHGLFVYQEQIMNTACIVADYSLGEADLLRRAMGKKKSEEMKAQRERFLEGAANRKIQSKKAIQIFDAMEKFAEYSFNKGHSTAYAMITYQTAYLKAHFPAEFMAALMTVESGNTDKTIQSMAECRDLEIEVLPPDINESSDGFTPVQGGIRFGLEAMKNIGSNAVGSIIEARDSGGSFGSIFDFCDRVNARKINRRAIEALIKSGSFDSLKHSRAELTEGIELILSYISASSKNSIDGQSALFELTDTLVLPTLPKADEWNEEEVLKNEMEVLGFYVSSHPLKKYSKEIEHYANADTESLFELQDKQSVTIAGLPRSVKIRKSKNGNNYAIIILEDLKGSVEVVAFNDCLQGSIDLLERKVEPLIVRGTVEKADEGVKVKASQIGSLLDERSGETVHIKIKRENSSTKTLQNLCEVFERHPGDSVVRVHLTSEEDELVIEVGLYRVNPGNEFVSAVEKELGNDSLYFQ